MAPKKVSPVLIEEIQAIIEDTKKLNKEDAVMMAIEHVQNLEHKERLQLFFVKRRVLIL